MSKDNTIENFWVALGFKTDEAGAKKMAANIEAVAINVAGVTAALGAMALAATAAVAKIASTFNTLYYESGRVGSSVSNLKAMSYAFSQVGGSADQAKSVIESFSRATRTNPGPVKFVKDLGVDVKADKWDQVLGVVEKLRAKQPYYIAAQQAEMLGIDESSYNLLSRNLDQLKHYAAERKRIAKSVGLDDDSAADASKKFSQALGTLTATIEVVAVKIATTLMPPITKFMKEVGDWIEKHPREIEEAVRAIGAFALACAVAFGHIAKALAPVAEAFAGMVKMLGENGQIETAMSAFAVFLVASWVPKILGAFGLIGGGWLGMLAKLGITAGAIAAFNAGSSLANNGVRGTDSATGGAMDKPPLSLEGNEGWARKYLRRGWNATKRAFGMGASAADASGGVARHGGNAEGARESYNFWRTKGLTHEQAAGLVGMEQGESQFNPRARGDGDLAHGAFQHHPDRRAKILNALGINISTATHQQQLEAAHWEMTKGQERGFWDRIKQAKTPGEAAATGVRYFERPRDIAGESRLRGQYANSWAARFAGSPAVIAKPDAPAPAPIVVPFAAPKGFNPGSFDVSRLGGQPMGSSSTSNDNSRSVVQHIKQDVKIDAAGDPQRAASMMERSFNRMNQGALANAQSVVR